MERFCIKCGKRGIDGLYCSECKVQSINVQDIRLKVCADCHKIFHKNRWTSKAYEEVVKELIIKSGAFKDFDVEVPDIEYNPGATHEIELAVLTGSDECRIPAVFEVTYCPTCSRKGSQYFEGILQVRKANERIMCNIRRELTKLGEKGVFVNKKEKLGGGADFYLTSKKALIILGNRLYQRFGGNLKISEQLFSKDRQTSKDIYRINVMFEPPGFDIGDIIEWDGKLFRISKLGSNIKAFDMQRGKGVMIKSKDMKDYSTVPIKKAQVVTIYPKVEILDPETYQPVKLVRPEKVEIGDMISVVQFRGRFFQV